MKKMRVTITKTIDIAIDVKKFMPEFMAAFKESFADCNDIKEYAEKLAELYLTGGFEGYDVDDLLQIGVRLDGLETEVRCLQLSF